MKVKINNKWEKINPFSLKDFGNYTILTPDMVSNLGTSYQSYSGTATHLIIDDSFLTDKLNSLFDGNDTLKSLVILTDKFTDMSYMLNDIRSQFETLFINTSNVTNMQAMFQNYKDTSLNLSSFDTSNVTNMNSMFQSSNVTTLDLSSFDTSSVTDMSWMFYGSSATVGYARTQAEADKFNASSGKPAALNFIVKP